jgi:hypothetical protein
MTEIGDGANQLALRIEISLKLVWRNFSPTLIVDKCYFSYFFKRNF